MTTFQTIAKEFTAAFEQRTRDDGNTFYTLSDTAPEWMQEALREAHSDGRLPDDWIYERCFSMLESIQGLDCADPEEQACEIADVYTDVYTSVLAAWLASNTRNVEACDEAVEEGLCEPDVDMVDRMTRGQFLLLDRACQTLIHAIKTQADERDATEDES